MRISDWSSDVCSSDLHGGSAVYGGGAAGGVIHINTLKAKEGSPTFETTVAGSSSLTQIDTDGLSGRLDQKVSGTSGRSAERRLGKECVSTCSSRWSQIHEKKQINKLYKSIDQQ